MRLLIDDDLSPSRATVLDAMRAALREHAAGTLRAPPRWSLDVPAGSLRFTCGAALDAGVMGFRVYETLGHGEGHEQLVAVWDADSGEFRGAVVGHDVGVLRTAGINAVATDALAREDATTLGVLGTGTQARAGAELTAAVRDFERVRVHSPTREHREAFAGGVEVDAPVTATDDPEAAVRGADVLYCATDSADPVFEADWLADGAHVCSLGPKSGDAHELPRDAIRRADALVTDSAAQLDEYDPGAFLGDDRERVVELGDVLAGVRRDPDDVSVFLSVGLAGTEVVLADRLL